MLVIGALRPSLLPGLTYHAAHAECLRAAGLRCGLILRLTVEFSLMSAHGTKRTMHFAAVMSAIEADIDVRGGMPHWCNINATSKGAASP